MFLMLHSTLSETASKNFALERLTQEPILEKDKSSTKVVEFSAFFPKQARLCTSTCSASCIDKAYLWVQVTPFPSRRKTHKPK